MDNYNIISNESLLLSVCPAVNLIISVLESVNNPENELAKAFILMNWDQITETEYGTVSYHDIDSELDRKLPEGFREMLEITKQLPVFESIEYVIQFFELGNFPEYTAYLSTLQDYVLELSGNRSADIPTFLDWWNTTGSGKSIILSDQQDSIRLLF